MVFFTDSWLALSFYLNIVKLILSDGEQRHITKVRHLIAT